MKIIEIFEEAMCCPTGLCGPSINPDLLRISAVLDTLKRKGIDISRHNLKDEPQLYVSNKKVNDFLMKNGVEGLPITLLDGEIVLSKTYPSTKQLSEWTGINLNFIPTK
jgi:Arsenical resistance operon protein ArsD